MGYISEVQMRAAYWLACCLTVDHVHYKNRVSIVMFLLKSLRQGY